MYKSCVTITDESVLSTECCGCQSAVDREHTGALLCTITVWMTFVESGWNVWVWLVGVGGIYGCG